MHRIDLHEGPARVIKWDPVEGLVTVKLRAGFEFKTAFEFDTAPIAEFGETGRGHFVKFHVAKTQPATPTVASVISELELTPDEVDKLRAAFAAENASQNVPKAV